MLRLSQHPDGITGIDVEYLRPGLAAVHLVESGGHAAFVDTGTNHAVPLLLEALERRGLSRASVDYLLLTHVHLDHAGGAGRLLRELPNARVVVHPRGAPHLVDPAKLIAGSIAVYGEASYRELYGELVAVPPERLLVTGDAQRLALAGRALEVLHTPGHALHHQAFADREAACVFAGDTFGVSYREFDTARGPFVLPTTTPTQFDPQQLVASIDRLLGLAPRTVYLMHFGAVADVVRLGAELRQQVADFAALALAVASGPAATTGAGRAAAIRAAMRALLLERLRAHGVEAAEARLEGILGQDLDLNTQGLMAWLERRK